MVEYPHAELQASPVKPKRKPFGRNQLVGLVALAVPFGFATAWVFMGKAQFSEWAAFCQLHVPMVLGLIVGASAAVKLRAAGAPQ